MQFNKNVSLKILKNFIKTKQRERLNVRRTRGGGRRMVSFCFQNPSATQKSDCKVGNATYHFQVRIN